MKVSWEVIKSFSDSRGIPLQWVDLGSYYLITCADGPQHIQHKMSKNNVNQSDVDEFLSSYAPSGNNKLSQIDSDGATIARTKTTESGWHYEPRSIDFEIGGHNTLYNRKHEGSLIDDGTDYGDAYLRFYDAIGDQIIQGELEADEDYQIRLDQNCYLTVMDWQPTYDMDIIGGSIQVRKNILNNSYVWCIIAPDIPEQFGGSVPYFSGGLNLSFFSPGSSKQFDGRGIKRFVYDPVYNSNKFRFVIKHEAGEDCAIQIILDQFKA